MTAPALDTLDPLDPEELAQLRREALVTLYGASFPLLDTDAPTPEAWGAWAEQMWNDLHPTVARRLLFVERNRLMYQGQQWVTQVGRGWREPPKPRDAARPVCNLVKPAIDHRLTLMMEQRPGFKTKPASTDSDDRKKARAQQVALEYAYDAQRMPEIMREAGLAAALDGVSFIELYWDPDAGPWHETLEGDRWPMGDVAPRVWRMDQVRVSPNATATQRPMWWVLCEELPRAQALKEYGIEALQGAPASERTGSSKSSWASIAAAMQNGLFTDRLIDQETSTRYKVYCERSEYLPHGLTLVVVDGIAVYEGELLTGRCPVVRVSDGSNSPDFFHPALMEDWLPDQVNINAVLGKWIESIRKSAGGRLLVRPDTVAGETLIGGILSAIEVRGTGPLADSVQPLSMPGLAQDAKEFLQFSLQAFEQKSGWNDASRGSFSGEASGRAILAQREALERIFAPPINAMARALSEWAEHTLHFMRWGYALPRRLAVVGRGRPDYARELSNEDFDGVADVFIDPQALMPMPTSLKMFMVDQMFDKGIMDAREYRRRLPFVFADTLDTPDDDHEARAHRVVEALRRVLEGQPVPPIYWMDNEAIHQDVLERELILPDGVDETVRQYAMQRWFMLAQQFTFKQQMGMVAPPLAGAPTPTPGMPPTQQPMMGINPPVAAAPVSRMAAESDQQRAGMTFEMMAQR